MIYKSWSPPISFAFSDDDQSCSTELNVYQNKKHRIAATLPEPEHKNREARELGRGLGKSRRVALEQHRVTIDNRARQKHEKVHIHTQKAAEQPKKVSKIYSNASSVSRYAQNTQTLIAIAMNCIMPWDMRITAPKKDKSPDKKIDEREMPENRRSKRSINSPSLEIRTRRNLE